MPRMTGPDITRVTRGTTYVYQGNVVYALQRGLLYSFTMFATQSTDVPPRKPQVPFLYPTAPSPCVPPMPDHWKGHFEGKRFYAIVLEYFFKMLCLLSFGSRNLDILWSKVGNGDADPSEFVAYKDRAISKISTVTVVVSHRIYAQALSISNAAFSAWITS